MADQLTMSIGEVAARGGIRPSALRYYEQAGLIPPPVRVAGRRVYGERVLTRLAVIRLGQEAGFTIAEIKTLVSGLKDSAPSARLKARWRRLAQIKLEDLERTIMRAHAMKRLLQAGLECGCLDLAECELVLGRMDPAILPVDPGLRSRPGAPRRRSPARRSARRAS
ncbi:MAG TPA: MerR family transcriptional regulator [Actinomycetota bacterium]|nr:MerR family transcriptional regulator [Actinomycetota bacterium]